VGKLTGAFAAGLATAAVIALATLYVLDLDVVDRSDSAASDSGDSGQVTVPQVVGLPAAQAKREVEDAGLTASVFNTVEGIDLRPATSVPNRVVAQTPAAGSEVEEGTVVGLDAGGG